jgi:hypothetical protein
MNRKKIVFALDVICLASVAFGVVFYIHGFQHSANFEDSKKYIGLSGIIPALALVARSVVAFLVRDRK